MRWIAGLLLTAVFALLLPVDSSAQWREVHNGGSVFYNEVFFIDTDHGWVTEMGSSVVRTTDGGATWQTSTLPNTTGSANRDICFVSTSTGYVSGSDGVWKSVDGGSSWTKLTVSGFAGGSNSIWFIDANNGIMAEGVGTIATFYRTTDGGSTWTASYDTVAGSNTSVGGIAYMNGKYYVAGDVGNLWRSSDGGVTWEHFNTGAAGWQEDMISFGGKLYIASADGSISSVSGGGKVLRNTTSDIAWASSSFPSTIIWGITMTSSSDGWTCGETGKAYRTTDGGSTWTDRSCGIDPAAHIDDIWFASTTRGWCVGQSRPTNGITHGAIYQFVSDYARAIPDTIDFGEVLVGTTTPDRIAKVLGIGNSLTLTRAIGGVDPTQFGATGSLAGTQTIPGYCGEATTPLHFNPTSVGQKRAYLEYTYANGTPGPRVVLLGRGVKPELNAVRTAIFDTLQCSVDGLDTVMVANDGFYPLTVSNATFSSQTNGSFQLLSPALPVTIPSGTSRQFIVRATATGPGMVTGTMTLANNDPDRASYQIALSAFRRQIAVGFDRDTLLTVASAPIGQPVSICITYRNAGNATQKIDQITPVGAGTPAIIHTPSMAGISLRTTDPPVSICFTVTPSDTGWITQRFRIRTGPCGADTFVTVRVYGSSPFISSTSQKIISDLCGSNAEDTIQLRNTGNAPLVVQQPTITGLDRALFTLVSPTAWPATIPPGGMLPLTVRYASGATGTRTAALLLRSNDRRPGKDEWIVALNGVRETVRLRARERSRDLGSICLGSTADASIALWNEGSAPVTFASAGLLDPPDGIRLVSASAPADPVIAGRSTPLGLRIEGLAVGPFTARLAIGYGPCDFGDTIEISGQVVSAVLSLDKVFDLGELPIGVQTRRTANIVNSGTIPATIRSVRLATPGTGITINIAALPLVLPPGASTPVELVLTPTSEATVLVDLLVEGDGLCADSLREPVSYRAIAEQVIAERVSVQFEPLLPCQSDAGWLDTVLVKNFGTAEARITGVRLAVGGNGFTVENPVPATIPAGGRSALGIRFRPASPGSYLDTLIVETTGEGAPRTLRVPLSGQSERLDLAAVNRSGDRIDRVTFDELSACTPTRVATVDLHNFGTLGDTVTVTSADPAVVVLTPMPIIIAPGEEGQLTVRAARTGTGGSRDIPLLVAARTCDRELTLLAHTVEVDLATRLEGLDYRLVNIGRSVDLDAELVNSGTSARTIARVVLGDPLAPFVILDDLAGRTIAPGETIPVPVRYSPVAEGSSSVELRAILTTPCDDTVRATVAGTGVKSAIFIGEREIDFGARFRCDAICQQVVVEGTGNVPVTITAASVRGDDPDARWTVSPSNFPLTVEPGASLAFTICFDAPASETISRGNLVILTDDLAQPTIEIPVQGQTIGGLSADSAIAFSSDPVTGGDTTIVVRNGSDVALAIDRATLPPGFVLVDPLPITIPPGGEITLALRFDPSITGATGRGMLVLGHSLPCADSILMKLDAAGAGVLTSSAPAVRGRWGEKVRVPVTLDNPRALSLGSLELVVTADPRLLHPILATPSDDVAAAGWRVEPGSFDAATGAYRFELVAPSGSTAQPRGTIAWIEYEVLRGDAITTPIDPAIGSLAPGVRAESVSGSFVLEDYCDAYGRLLTTSGRFKLGQNTPNPARGRSEIELEIPFAGDVVLAIFDATGREVARPVDEWLPAGTRRVEIDADALSSGVYSYRLRLGLLVETRRMVIAR